MGKKKLSPKWEKRKGFKKPFEYTIESSEQEVTLRRLDMGDLLKMGIANEVDFVSKALMSADPKPEETTKESISNAISQADNYAKMETMINIVVVNGCLDPKLEPLPEDEAERDSDLLYVDEIPWDDRMELFGVIFEMDGVATFREEQEPSVGDLADVPVVPLPADGSLAVRPSDPEGILPESGGVLLREESGTSDVGSGSEIPVEQEARTGS